MSLSLTNSTIIPLLDGSTFTGSAYDNILDFVEINISIKCDTGYDLTYIYSQDKISIDYQTTQSISAQADTQFYKITVKDRYFKLQIDATDGDMSVLNVQTIYKTSTTYSVSSGPSSNVVITNPLNGSGYVEVVDMNNNYDVSGNLKVSVQNNPAGDSVQLANGFVSTHTNSYQIKYLYKNLTVYGFTDTNMILRLELSDDDSTYYPTQYAYTVNSGAPVGFNIPAGAYNWVRFAVNNSVNNLVLFLNYN